MDKKIAVLGAGAIGGSVGADLTKAGYDVVLIDQWPAHVEAMKANGLRVIMPDEELHTPVRAYHLCEVCSLRHSEVGYVNGLVVKKGKQANVPTPYNGAITEITRQIELGALKPDRSNLALVQKMIR